MSLVEALYLALAFMCLAARTVAADPATVRFHHYAAALEERGQLQKINYVKDENVLVLYDMLLIEDNAPGIVRRLSAPQPQAETWRESDNSLFVNLQSEMRGLTLNLKSAPGGISFSRFSEPRWTRWRDDAA